MSILQASNDEVAQRGQEWYERTVRARVERDENIGKLVWIDTGTGDFEIGEDDDLEAPRRLHTRHPGAAVFAVRIGYNAVDAVGGVLERTSPIGASIASKTAR